MKVLKATGKREMEKSDIAKLYEKGKDKTEGTFLFDDIKRITLSEHS